MSPSEASGEQIKAMFAAAEAGDLGSVKKLLADGVDPNVRNKLKATPLIVAAGKGHEEVFFTLAEVGADLHATRGYGDSVLLKAAMGNTPARLRMVQAVIGAGGLGPDDSLANAFAVGCQLSSVEIIQALLAAGADPNHEYLPLWSAVRKNRPEIVAELIRAGADVNIRIPREEFGDNKHARKTLLEAAHAEGYAEVAKVLEAAGAKMPPKPKRPTTPTPVADSWKRIAAWLKKNAPDWKPLRRGVTVAKLAAAEKKFGFKLPTELRESYETYCGDDSGQIFPCRTDISFYLMSFTAVVDNWKMMKELFESGEFKDSDKRVKNEKGVQKIWWDPGWIPFASNGGGDYFCLDLNPAKGGTAEQVIHFRHDAEERTLLAPSLRAFLYELATGLEDGKYRYGNEDGIV